MFITASKLIYFWRRCDYVGAAVVCVFFLYTFDNGSSTSEAWNKVNWQDIQRRLSRKCICQRQNVKTHRPLSKNIAKRHLFNVSADAEMMSFGYVQCRARMKWFLTSFPCPSDIFSNTLTDVWRTSCGLELNFLCQTDFTSCRKNFRIDFEPKASTSAACMRRVVYQMSSLSAVLVVQPWNINLLDKGRLTKTWCML